MDILECSTRTLYGKMMATLAVKFEFTPRMLGAETTRFMKHQFDSIEGNPTRIIYGHSMGLSFLLSFILSFFPSFIHSFFLSFFRSFFLSFFQQKMLNLLPAGENPHLPNFETPPRRKQMTKLERRCQICQTGRKIKSSFSIRLAKSNDYDTNETMKQMNRPKSMRRMASNFENVIRFDLFRFAKSSESQLTEFRNIVNCAKMAE